MSIPKTQTEYLNNLLGAIEFKRNLSIKEFVRTDLNNTQTIESIDLWYNELVNIVSVNCPDNYVKGVYILEKDNHIELIKYDYLDECLLCEYIAFCITSNIEFFNLI